MTTKISSHIGTGKQTFYVLSGKLISLFSTLAIPLILTRFLSQGEYGLYSQFNAIILFMTSIFSLGFQANLYYFMPNESSENKRIFVFQTYLLLLFFGMLSILIFEIPAISNFLTGTGEVSNYRVFIIVGMFLVMPTLMLDALYIVSKDIKTSLVFPPVQSFIKIIFILIGLLFFTSNIQTVFIAQILALSCSFIFSIFYVKKYLSCKHKQRLYNFKKLISQLRYSLPFGGAIIMNTIVRRIDKIICISYLSTTDYAIYSIAFIGIPGIQQIYDSISQVLIVQIVGAAKESKIKVLDLYKQLVSKTLSYTIPVIIIVSWFARDIIQFLFTQDYVGATPFFQLYLTSFIVGMLGAGIILRATGNTKLTFRAYTISGIIIIPLSFILISKFWIWGAISTALLGAFLPKMIMIYMEIKIIGCKFSEYFPWENLLIIIVISTLMLLPVFALGSFIPKNIFIILSIIASYLLIVFSFEVKYEVFVVDKKFISKNYYMFKSKLCRVF